MRIFGIILIGAGILAVAISSVQWTKHEKMLDLGPIEAVKETKESLPISPIIGVVAVVGGSALVIASALRKPA